MYFDYNNSTVFHLINVNISKNNVVFVIILPNHKSITILFSKNNRKHIKKREDMEKKNLQSNVKMLYVIQYLYVFVLHLL